MRIANIAITVLRRLLDGLLLALVAVSLGVLVLGRIVPLLGHPTLVVAGPSMEPTLPLGAAVVLDQVPTSSLAVGDIVSLRSGAERAIFTHRIVRLAEQDGVLYIETQGDANPAPDPSLTPAAAVLGRVVVEIPYAGYLLTLYSSVSGILFVLSIGLTLLFLGIFLEPADAPRRPVTPASTDHRSAGPALPPGPAVPTVPADLAPDWQLDLAPPVRQVPRFERATVQEVVRASRERRARQARWASGRSGHSATRG
jgi:signal peptidase